MPLEITQLHLNAVRRYTIDPNHRNLYAAVDYLLREKLVNEHLAEERIKKQVKVFTPTQAELHLLRRVLSDIINTEDDRYDREVAVNFYTRLNS